MESKRFKLTFFEKFKNAVSAVWHNFFDEELPESPSKVLVQKIDKVIELAKTKKYSKKEGIRKCKGAQECLLYVKGYQQRSIDAVTEAINTIKGTKLGKIEIKDIDTLKDPKKRKQMKNIQYKSSGLVDVRELEEKKKEGVSGIHEKVFEFMYDFNFEGKKIFRIEEQLMEELLLTDFSNIDDSFFILPYNTICIHVPYNQHLSVREKKIEWIFLTQWIEESCKYIEVLTVSEDETIDYGQFTLCGGDIIRQIIRQTNEKWDSGLARREMKELFTFIISVLLYTNSTDADIQICQPHIVDRKTDSSLQLCKLGGLIKIDKMLLKIEIVMNFIYLNGL